MKNLYKNRIVINPKILGGKPIIKGTRISVEFILELIASGLTIENILEEYPHLTKKDILAAISYAVSILKKEEIISPRELATFDK